jgi:hypothetical protein
LACFFCCAAAAPNPSRIINDDVSLTTGRFPTGSDPFFMDAMNQTPDLLGKASCSVALRPDRQVTHPDIHEQPSLKTWTRAPKTWLNQDQLVFEKNLICQPEIGEICCLHVYPSPRVFNSPKKPDQAHLS